MCSKAQEQHCWWRPTSLGAHGELPSSLEPGATWHVPVGDALAIMLPRPPSLLFGHF